MEWHKINGADNEKFYYFIMKFFPLPTGEFFPEKPRPSKKAVL